VGIELCSFIKSVRDEIVKANNEVNKDEAVLSLEGIELEVAFTAEMNASGTAKFLVADLGGELRSERVHRVTLKLTPINRGTGAGAFPGFELPSLPGYEGLPVAMAPDKG
jgi:Trypsin-co-occurring domain 2